MLDETTVHVLAGGIGGTVGAIFTCPLELIKVRLQSSQGRKFSRGETSEIPQEFPRNTRYFEASSQALNNSVWNSQLRAPDAYYDHASPQKERAKFCEVLQNESTNPIRAFHSSDSPSTINRLLRSSKILRCMSDVIKNEGTGALFKGLFPTLVGVLPSRGIYFCAYHKGQNFFQDFFTEGHSAVFLCSAAFSSITASTLTCPIWYVKTRLQLDSRPCSSHITVVDVVRSTWRQLGIRGFYRGISASYVGSIETALNFGLYENLKGWLLHWNQLRRFSNGDQAYLSASCCSKNDISVTIDNADYDEETSGDGVFATNLLRGTQGGSKLNSSSDMMLCMLASATSKAIAITISYPHEVARTRMREEGFKYRTFVGTLRTVFTEEGFFGLYRGLGTHYIRQIPNSCLLLGTYEGVVYFLQSSGLGRFSSTSP